MPNAVRLNDICSGHSCGCGGFYPPRPNDQGSPNVFTNGLNAHRLTDHWVTHTCSSCGSSHDSNASSGSSTVFINGLNACRIGDNIACTSKMVKGSNNVFIGG